MKLIDEIRKIKSTAKELREFGITFSAVFGIFTGICWWKGSNYFPFLIPSFVFLALGFLWPASLKPLQKPWMILALLMGWVMSRVILTLVFFLVITPIGIISRFQGTKHLDMSFRTGASSYWNLKPVQPFDKKRYEKQF